MSNHLIAVAMVATGLLAVGCVMEQAGPRPSASRIALPTPQTDGQVTLEEALSTRRSVREFAPDPLSQEQIGQLLWAAQGVTDAQGHRTAPSAGALYPLELYVVTADAVSHYLPADHAIELLRDGDVRPRLRAAASDQTSVGEAPLVIVVAAVPARTEAKYGAERASRYIHLETGHAAQNVLLQAVALGLGAVPIGAFDDVAVAQAIGLPEGEVPLYLLPIGNRR